MTPESLPPPDPGRRATFGIRLAAALIDGCILLVLYFALVKAAGLVMESGILGKEWRRADPVFMAITLGNALVLAYSFLEVLYGVTLGKRVLGLRIRADDGASPGVARLLARYAIKHGARLCGLIDALSSIRNVRLLYAWGPMPIFRRQPLEFLTLRTIGELLGLFVVVGFFFTLGKSEQALYDRICRTGVYRPRAVGPARRGFEPLPVLPAEPKA